MNISKFSVVEIFPKLFVEVVSLVFVVSYFHHQHIITTANDKVGVDIQESFTASYFVVESIPTIASTDFTDEDSSAILLQY